MQLNKTYLNVGIGLVVMAGLTAFLVLKAPNRNGAAAAKPSSDPVGLNQPRGLAFASDGDLIVVDSRNHRLAVRHTDGTLVKYVGAAFGTEGEGKGEFREPCDAAVDAAGDVFVADTFHTLDAHQGLPWGRIEKFNSAYDYLGEVSQSPSGAQGFFGPRAVAVDRQGRVWMSDTGNSRLLVFDNDLKFIRAIGTRGTGNLQFQEPFGLAADAEGNMYVADRLNFRIQVISPDFRLLRQFKVDGWESSQINQFPYLAVDNHHHWLWVSDPTKHRILRYGLQGGGRKVFDKALFGPVSSSMELPTGVAVAADGTLYISDSGSGRILTLKP
ncbi:MAG TPA: NHL repeat-containing protein [bacterium]|jgi:DNA-binding beta-propeller fold protein YncE|nr:NHL repeat-containing protein [bacterium]